MLTWSGPSRVWSSSTQRRSDAYPAAVLDRVDAGTPPRTVLALNRLAEIETDSGR